jgi:hypothetical protein
MRGILSFNSLDMGIYEMVLENGIHVSYRFNDYLEDEILIKASAPGGLSEVNGTCDAILIVVV